MAISKDAVCVHDFLCESASEGLSKLLLFESFVLMPFCLGARYNPSKGGFFWPDDTAVVYSSWNKGEPRFGLDCSIMVNRKGWGTERCDMERNYICKIGELTYSLLQKCYRGFSEQRNRERKEVKHSFPFSNKLQILTLFYMGE